MLRTVHIQVFGRVQGVFFRQGTRDQAEALCLNGWVRNRPDLSVEILAAGEEKNIEQLILWCHKGPGRAVVDKVVVKESSMSPFTSFEILR